MGNVRYSILLASVVSGGAWGIAVGGVTRTVDFEGEGAVNGSTISVGGFGGLGSRERTLSGSMLHVDSRVPASVTFDGLGMAPTLELSFALALIDSWDGEALGRSYAPDFIGVRVNGEEVFLESFTNFNDGYINPTWRASYDPALRLTHGQLFGRGWNDSVYDIVIPDIDYDGGPVTVEFFATGSGFQGGTDESFGIDSLTLAAVPAPGPALAALLAGALASHRRR